MPGLEIGQGVLFVWMCSLIMILKFPTGVSNMRDVIDLFILNAWVCKKIGLACPWIVNNKGCIVAAQ